MSRDHRTAHSIMCTVVGYYNLSALQIVDTLKYFTVFVVISHTPNLNIDFTENAHP